MGTPLLKMSKLGAQPVQGTPSCAWEERGFFSPFLQACSFALCQDASTARSSLLGPLSTRAAAAAARRPPGAARDAPCATHTQSPPPAWLPGRLPPNGKLAWQLRTPGAWLWRRFHKQSLFLARSTRSSSFASQCNLVGVWACFLLAL